MVERAGAFVRSNRAGWWRWCSSLALPAVSRGAITVANTNDEGPGSLRQAIEDAGSGETIVVPAGTYTLANELSINKSLTISGNSAVDTIIRAGAPNRVVYVTGVGHDVTIAGVTVRDGSGVTDGAGIYNNEANLSLREVVIADNHASADGEPGQFGGIANGGGIRSIGGSLRIVDSTIRGNVVSSVGGAGKFGGHHRGRRPREREPADDPGIDVHREHRRRARRPGNRERRTVRRQCDGGRHLDRCPPGRRDQQLARSPAISPMPPEGRAAPRACRMAVASSSSRTPGPRPRLTGLTITANEARGLGDPKSSERIKGGGLYFDGGAGAGLAVTATTLAANSVNGGESEGGNLFWSRRSDPDIPGHDHQRGRRSRGKRELCGRGGLVRLQSREHRPVRIRRRGRPDQRRPQARAPPGQRRPHRDDGARPPRARPWIAARISGLPTDQRGIQRPFDFPQIPDSPAAGGRRLRHRRLRAAARQRPVPTCPGRLQRNRKKGTATLTVTVPVPGNGIVTLLGKGLRMQSAPVADIATIQLPVIVAGKKVPRP